MNDAGGAGDDERVVSVTRPENRYPSVQRGLYNQDHGSIGGILSQSPFPSLQHADMRAGQVLTEHCPLDSGILLNSATSIGSSLLTSSGRTPATFAVPSYSGHRLFTDRASHLSGLLSQGQEFIMQPGRPVQFAIDSRRHQQHQSEWPNLRSFSGWHLSHNNPTPLPAAASQQAIPSVLPSPSDGSLVHMPGYLGGFGPTLWTSPVQMPLESALSPVPPALSMPSMHQLDSAGYGPATQLGAAQTLNPSPLTSSGTSASSVLSFEQQTLGNRGYTMAGHHDEHPFHQHHHHHHQHYYHYQQQQQHQQHRSDFVYQESADSGSLSTYGSGSSAYSGFRPLASSGRSSLSGPSSSSMGVRHPLHLHQRRANDDWPAMSAPDHLSDVGASLDIFGADRHTASGSLQQTSWPMQRSVSAPQISTVAQYAPEQQALRAGDQPFHSGDSAALRTYSLRAIERASQPDHHQEQHMQPTNASLGSSLRQVDAGSSSSSALGQQDQYHHGSTGSTASLDSSSVASSSRSPLQQTRKSLKHRCPYCNSGFPRKWDLERHVNDSHRNTKVYRCRFCDREFKRKDNRLRHETTVHRDMMMGDAPPEEQPRVVQAQALEIPAMSHDAAMHSVISAHTDAGAAQPGSTTHFPPPPPASSLMSELLLLPSLDGAPPCTLSAVVGPPRTGIDLTILADVDAQRLPATIEAMSLRSPTAAAQPPSPSNLPYFVFPFGNPPSPHP